MDIVTVIVLYKVLGLLLVTSGLGVLLNKQHAQKIVSGVLIGNSARVSLLLGALIISVHNVWIFGVPILLTLLGYLLFISGALSYLVPDVDLAAKKLGNANYAVVYGLIGLVVGIVFIYQGFFLY